MSFWEEEEDGEEDTKAVDCLEPGSVSCGMWKMLEALPLGTSPSKLLCQSTTNDRCKQRTAQRS